MRPRVSEGMFLLKDNSVALCCAEKTCYDAVEDCLIVIAYNPCCFRFVFMTYFTAAVSVCPASLLP